MSVEHKSGEAGALSRRKYEIADILHEISRVRGCIESGYFGQLSFEQRGKIHCELTNILNVVQTYRDDVMFHPDAIEQAKKLLLEAGLQEKERSLGQTIEANREHCGKENADPPLGMEKEVNESDEESV